MRNDARVRIAGERAFSGAVRLTFLSDGAEVIAAKVGDYYSPIDIRFDSTSDRLYIRTAGCSPLANTPFGGCGTTLFVYALDEREQKEKRRVESTVLSAECPGLVPPRGY